MKLDNAITYIFGTLQDNPFFQNMSIITPGDAYNERLEFALREKGLALVINLLSAEPTEPKAPRLRLRGDYMVSVVENPKQNTYPYSALRVAEEVLTTLHQQPRPEQRGLQHEVLAGKPALELGPLDGGLVTYFCHLSILCDYADS
jgi:hypothetical protein